MNNRGVMLIEMLVVIVVLGIVGAISIPSIQTVYANVQKDTVLNQARDIESAARFYCRLNNYTNCSQGMVIGEDELSPWLDSTFEGYDYSVTLGEGFNDLYVHLVKEDDYSFPYNESGEKIAMGQVPSESGKTLVNKAQSGVFEGYTSYETGDIYFEDDYAVYNGDLYQAAWWTQAVPGTDTSWQKITDEWFIYNEYYKGDEVYHEGISYIANDYSQGTEPGTSTVWQKQTDTWFVYNIYRTGDQVYHQGDLYVANDYSQGKEPGTSTEWQKQSDQWDPYNTYQQGEQVDYQGDSYIANDYSQGTEPGTSTVWQKQTDAWFVYNIYRTGDQVYYQGDLYEANDYTQGNQPGTTTHWTNLSSNIWNADEVYNGGDEVSYDGISYRAKWWTQGDRPDQHSSTWAVWEIIDE